MYARHLIRAITGVLTAAMVVLFPAVAKAIPAFAQQTGQPCTSCHIGAFGPQLTPFGRAFKIAGYTEAGGDAKIPVPLSLMLLGSYSNTTKGPCTAVRTIPNVVSRTEQAHQPPITTARMAILPWIRSASSWAVALTTMLAL